MSLFNLKSCIIYERFRANTNYNDWEHNGFDYELKFGPVTDQELNIIGDWLAENCMLNYILLKDTSEIIGGGSYDNKRAWLRKKFTGCNGYIREHKLVSGRVRLDRDDITAFRLTWIL